MVDIRILPLRWQDWGKYTSRWWRGDGSALQNIHRQKFSISYANRIINDIERGTRFKVHAAKSQNQGRKG